MTILSELYNFQITVAAASAKKKPKKKKRKKKRKQKNVGSLSLKNHKITSVAP